MNESELLSSICQTIVEVGGYQLAWVGYIEVDGARSVRPVAIAAPAADPLGTKEISWTDMEMLWTPTAAAIRTAAITAARDSMSNEELESWRASAAIRGCRSSVAIPLMLDGTMLGALTIESRDPHAFNESELEQFRDLTGDLSYGIGALRTRSAHDLLARIVESTQIGIVSEDAHGSITSWNKGAQAIFGYAETEIAGRNIDLLLPPEMKQDGTELIDRIRRGEARGVFETEGITKAGRRISVAVTASPIIDAAGAISGASIIVRDITDRKEAVSAIKDSELRYRRLFESAKDGILILDESTGMIVDVNPFLTDLLGYSREEFLDKQLWDIGTFKNIAASQEAFVELRSKGYVRYEDLPLEAKDGRQIEVEFVSNAYAAGDQRVIQCNIRDITERVRSERALQRATRALRTLSQGNSVLVHATSEEGLYSDMCRVIVENGGYRMAWIGMAQGDPEKSVQPIAHAGHETGYLDLVTTSWGDDPHGRGPTGEAIRTGKVHVNRDTANNPRMGLWQAEARKRGYASSIALPLREGEQTIGALSIYSQEVDAFGPEEALLLDELATDLSFGIVALRTSADRMVGLRRLDRALEETVQAIAGIVEMRDPYTAGHQRRVATISEAIATEMGLAADGIHGLRLASTVHDIGKIAIPAEILSKPGRLSKAEFDLIKSHPQIGYDILKPVTFPWPLADMVLQHHERIDGSGYPNGLKGDAILLEARIMAVADVVEAMVSHRPYRPALGLQAALREIRNGSGKLYDQRAVEACIKLAQTGSLSLES